MFAKSLRCSHLFTDSAVSAVGSWAYICLYRGLGIYGCCLGFRV